MDGAQKNSRIKSTNLEKLKHIIQQDYGLVLSDTEAERFGSSLLRVARLAMGAFDRAEEKRVLAST